MKENDKKKAIIGYDLGKPGERKTIISEGAPDGKIRKKVIRGE